MKVKKKIVIIVVLLLVSIVPIYRLMQRIEIYYYFRTHYDQTKYEIRRVRYYKTGNISDATDILESYGVSFPSYVYSIRPIDDIAETFFYIGATGFEIWDYYETAQLEYRLNLKIDDIISQISGAEDARIRISVRDEEFKNKDKMDMENYYKILKLGISGTKIDKEELIEIIKDVNRRLEENSIYINRFNVHIYIGEETRHFWFDYDELNSENLLNILDETLEK